MKLLPARGPYRETLTYVETLTCDSRLHVVEPPEEVLSSAKSESTHPSRTVVKSIDFFMESSQLYAATLTHYSTKPLTTGPDYDPLLLLLTLAGDVHPNPGPSRYPCSVCFKNVTSQGTSYLCTRCSHCVHSRCSGLRNAADYRKANGWICTACMTPPRPRALSPPPSPAHTPTMSDTSFNIQQWNANGIGNKQMELSILEAHDVKVAAIQESKLTAKLGSPNIQNYTVVRHDRRQGPGGGLLFFINNSVSFTRKSLSTTSKNDPHLEELTTIIAMDNTELLIANVYTPSQFLQWVLFTTNRPLADRHRFTSPRRLQCSPFTLALRNNRFERQSTGGFGQYFQLCSPKYRFTHKTPW